MIYFIHGDIPLQLKFDEILKNIKKENPGIPEKYYDMSQDETDEIFQTLSTNSMFIPKSLIVITRLEESKKFKEFVKSLKEFNLSQKIIIMLYEEKLDDYGRLTNEINKTNMKYISNVAKIITARQKDERKTLQFFIENELSCTEYDAKKIIEMVGEDVFKIKNELQKIKNFLNGESFNLEKIKPILSISKEYNIFALIEDFLLHENTKTLINFLKKEKLYLLFTRVLADELTTLYKLKDLQKRRIIDTSMSYSIFKERSYPKIKEYFIKNEKSYFIQNDFRYTKEYPIFLKFRYLDKYSLELLEKNLKKLIICEYNFMSGLMEVETAIEVFILNFF